MRSQLRGENGIVRNENARLCTHACRQLTVYLDIVHFQLIFPKDDLLRYIQFHLRFPVSLSTHCYSYVSTFTLRYECITIQRYCYNEQFYLCTYINYYLITRKPLNYSFGLFRLIIYLNNVIAPYLGFILAIID